MKLQHKYFFVFSSFFLALLLSFCVFCLLVLFFYFFWIFARSWGILPIPEGTCLCLGDFTHSWGILPVPGGYCPCLVEPARAWGILLHLMKGFTSSRGQVSMDPADRVPPTPATQWHHPASNHKGILEGEQSSIKLLLTGFRSNQNIPLVQPPAATHQANSPPPHTPNETK